MIKQAVRKFRDRLREAETKINSRKTPRGRGNGYIGHKHNKDLYDLGGKFKDRY